MIASTLTGIPEEEEKLEQELKLIFESATLTYELQNNQAHFKNAEDQQFFNLTLPEKMNL